MISLEDLEGGATVDTEVARGPADVPWWAFGSPESCMNKTGAHRSPTCNVCGVRMKHKLDQPRGFATTRLYVPRALCELMCIKLETGQLLGL